MQLGDLELIVTEHDPATLFLASYEDAVSQTVVTVPCRVEAILPKGMARVFRSPASDRPSIWIRPDAQLIPIDKLVKFEPV